MSGRPMSHSAGFSLVEILIVLAVGACVLGGGWSWVWAVTSAGARTADAVEARTSLAYARRVLLADLRCASGLAAGRPSTTTGLTLTVPSWRRADGLVTVNWDESRSVLWRVTSGCHLAEDVDDFRVTYLDAGGNEVACGEDALGEPAAETVRGVIVEMRVCADRAVACGRWAVWFERVNE